MNTHITVKNGELFSCDEKGENMVPFQQESYVVDDTAIKIYKPFENLVLNNFKEGEICPCPEGFSVNVGHRMKLNGNWIPMSEEEYRGRTIQEEEYEIGQYAKLVPIKEQPGICYNCQGRGSLPIAPTNSEVTCKVCNGTGGVPIKEQSAHSSQSKEELRKDFNKWCTLDKNHINYIDFVHRRNVFDWFYSKLSQKEQEIDRLKKELEELRNNLQNQ